MTSPSTSAKFAAAVGAALVLSLFPALASASASASAPGAALDAAQGARASSSSEVGAIAAGGTIGLAAGNGFTQLRLTGEGQYTLLQLQPQLLLEIAGHLGLNLGSGATIFEIVPEARIRYLMDSKLSFYGDGGLGLAFWSSNGFSQTWALLRFAGGVQYKITPQLSLLGEPVGLNFYLGTGSGFVYSLAGGVLYRF